MLLENGANPTVVDSFKRSPLHHAAVNGNPCVRELLEFANVKLAGKYFEMLSQADEYLMNPFHCAAENGQFETLLYMNKYMHGLQGQRRLPTPVDPPFIKSFRLAVQNHHIRVLQFLMETLNSVDEKIR